MNRRGFLGLLGLSPFGAKAAAEDTLVQMGFQHGSKVVSVAGPLVGKEALTGSAQPEGYPKGDSYMSNLIKSANKFRKLIAKDQIPEWKRKEIEYRAWMNAPVGMDPDIAVLQSTSPSWKALKQRKRNYDRHISYAIAAHLRQADMAEWQEKTGIHWYE